MHYTCCTKQNIQTNPGQTVLGTQRKIALKKKTFLLAQKQTEPSYNADSIDNKNQTEIIDYTYEQ